MALAATTVWEVRTAGSDTLCSGGYVAGGGGTDFSQQDAAQYTGTNLVIDGAVNTKVTSATHNFVAADVGNLMQITAGSGFTTGFFQIVSVAANAATLDRSAGTLGSTAGTFAVGGALATPGLAVANIVAGHTIYAKGSYTTTTNTSNVAGGRLTFSVSGSQTAPNRFIGYTTTRTDGGRYTITLGATFTGPVITNNSNTYNAVNNVAIVGNATSASKALALSVRENSVTNLKVSGFNAGGGHIVTVDNEAVLKDFEISGGATGTNGALTIGSSCSIVDGWIHGNAGNGVLVNGDAITTFIRVVSCDHTTSNGAGYRDTSNAHSVYFGCAAWNNGGDDWLIFNGLGTLVRCVSGGTTGYNFNSADSGNVTAIRLFYCAAKTNTTALYQAALATNVGLVTLTGDPFTNRAGGDFSLNNTAGAGASCRGITETIYSGLTTTFADIGPAQHQDAGGGGGGTGPNVIVSSGAGSRGGSW